MSAQFPTEWELREEITALEEEGYDVAEARRRLEAIAGKEEAAPERQAILREALAAPARRSDFHCHEPSDLEGIRAARPAGPRRLKANRTRRHPGAGSPGIVSMAPIKKE